MRKALQVLAVSAGAVALVLSGAAVASAKGTSRGAYTCTGGHIPSGSYTRLTVTGACDVPDKAVISVAGDVFVAAGAVLDAQSAPSTITVAGNVTALTGSLLGLGCQPDTTFAHHPCTVDPNGHSIITVKGNITALGADTVLLNGITVKGNVTLVGGGGANPWSVKNDTIRGNLTIIGVTSEFMVVLRNTIAGNVTLLDITETDTDPDPAVEIVVNTIGGNLVCFGLAPRAAGGFIPGQVNTVGGNAIGQCAHLVSG
jgi:hypothetical protein